MGNLLQKVDFRKYISHKKAFLALKNHRNEAIL